MSDSKAPARAASAIAITAATGAVACGACCVLPFALPAAMLAGFGGVLAFFANALAWATPLAVIAVVSAWVWIGWQSIGFGIWPALSTLVAMVIASALTAIAIAWPHIEPVLVRSLLQ